MRKRFARIYTAKINELSSHMKMGIDTPKREMLNLLVWAIPALLLSEDDTSIELHKEHRSKAAGLNQRLAEAERDEWTNLIERARRKQQEEWEKKKQTMRCLRAAKQILMGGTQATPCEETMKNDTGKTSERRPTGRRMEEDERKNR